MIITTTLSVEGRTVSEYLGIVSAAQVMVMPGGTRVCSAAGRLVSMERRKSCCNKRHLLARMPLSG